SFAVKFAIAEDSQGSAPWHAPRCFTVPVETRSPPVNSGAKFGPRAIDTILYQFPPAPLSRNRRFFRTLLLKWGRSGKAQDSHEPGTDHSLRRRRDAPVAAVARDRAETFPDLARWRIAAWQDRRSRGSAPRHRRTRRHHQPRLLFPDQGSVFCRDRKGAAPRHLSARAFRPQYRTGTRSGGALRGVALRRRCSPARAAVGSSDPRPARVHRRGRPREGSRQERLDRNVRHRSDPSRDRL